MLTWRKNLYTTLFSLWMVFGVYIDGYHHLIEDLDTFFTPWHAILYSGYLATAIWIFYMVLSKKKETGQSFRASIPKGYGLGVWGAIIFLLGGIGDMIWHTLFGIEKDVAALLSPTHLSLLIGALLMISSPFRWARIELQETKPTFTKLLPALLSIGLVISATAFFFLYAWAFRVGIPSVPWHDSYLASFVPEHLNDLGNFLGDLEKRGILNILLTTSFLFFPVYLMMKRWTLPLGSVTFLFVLPCLLMNVLDGLGHWDFVFLGLITGVFGDVILRKGRTVCFAIGLPIVLWGLYFIEVSLQSGLWWPPEIWGGAILFPAIFSYGLYVLSSPGQKETKETPM